MCELFAHYFVLSHMPVFFLVLYGTLEMEVF